MKKYIIELDKEEVEIVKMLFVDFGYATKFREDFGPIEDAILRGILDQILTQDRRFSEKK